MYAPTTRLRSDTTDMISNMPPNVTQLILELLPMRDAARTSVLSRYWRYIWTTISKLILDDKYYISVMGSLGVDVHAYCSMISNILLCHTGPICKFSLFIPPWFPQSTDISVWIRCVSAKGVEDLALTYACPTPIRPPSCLFSSIGFKTLKLVNCLIAPLAPTFNGFPSLTSLHLLGDAPYASLIDSKTLEALISGCPNLEDLSVVVHDVQNSPKISAPRLRNFVVEGDVMSIFFDATTRVKTLALYTAWELKQQMAKFLFFVADVEKLILGGIFWEKNHCFEFRNRSRIVNERLKTLSLSNIRLGCYSTVITALYLLTWFPNLQELKIHAFKVTPCPTKFSIMGFGANYQTSLINVDLANISGFRNELELIKLLLSCSPVLQTMTIQLSNRAFSAETQLDVAKEVISYCRASSRAKIILKT